MLNHKLKTYLSNFEWKRDPLLLRLEEEAREERIPIINLDSIQFISQLIHIKAPQHILEIGTAIGYSTIWMAKSNPHVKVTTIEIDEDKVIRARNNIAEAGLSERIEVLHADAQEGLPDRFRGELFDFIFFDAAKAQYEIYLEKYLPYLDREGMLITDNVFFHGLVYGEGVKSKREEWMGQQIDQYNQKLFAHSELETIFLPIGDGLSLSIIRKRDERN